MIKARLFEGANLLCFRINRTDLYIEIKKKLFSECNACYHVFYVQMNSINLDNIFYFLLIHGMIETFVVDHILMNVFSSDS